MWWNWEKAHIGIEGCKTADRQVKAGANVDIVDVQVDVAANTAKTILKKKLCMWQKRWDDKGTVTLINWALMIHGPFPDYFHCLRNKRLRRPFCQTTDPATSKLILIGL